MKTPTMQPSIDVLNNDILARIFDYLHFDDKIRLRRTCHRWKLLLSIQLNRAKALRIGHFNQGGYHITSGLHIQCDHQSPNHRQHTGTLFNERILGLPADIETRCFSINQYDYLHRSIKHCYKSITMLSLGRLNISYRLLLVITHNLPNLEHLELIGCASMFDQDRTKKTRCNIVKDPNQMPSLESFNTEPRDTIYSNILYNQHPDEQVNMEERLSRLALVKECDLVKESQSRNYWPNLKHLLVKECNLLNEFSLNLILAITSRTLNHLVVESNSYLTGEFFNYCGPQLKILRVKYCPMLQLKFLEDLVKLRQLLSSTTHSNSISDDSNKRGDLLSSNSNYPQPINSFMFHNYRNFNQQDIHCTI